MSKVKELEAEYRKLELMYAYHNALNKQYPTLKRQMIVDELENMLDKADRRMDYPVRRY